MAAGRRSLVVVPLDSDYALPQVAAAVKAVLEALQGAGLRDAVGLGLLSMLGFESTCEHLEVSGGTCLPGRLHCCAVCTTVVLAACPSPCTPPTHTAWCAVTRRPRASAAMSLTS